MTSPKTPKSDTLPRVVRGGTWDYPTASYMRAACRIDGTPSDRYISLGFRCAQRGCRMPLKGGFTQ